MTTNSIHDLQPQLAANRRYWTGWAGSDPDTDLPVYRTDLPHSLLNGVLRIHNRPLDEAIEEAKAQLNGSKWSWWVSSDSDEGTADALVARGAEKIGDMPIMAINVTDVAAVEDPADLKIRQVSGRSEMEEYVSAYSGPLGFPPDTDLAARVNRELGFAYPEVVRLAGIVDGKTVGTCTLSLGTDVGALYCIATDPDYRRQGIATDLTLEALRITRDSGRRIATLQASSEGEPVYERIGFTTVGRYRLFQLSEG